MSNKRVRDDTTSLGGDGTKRPRVETEVSLHCTICKVFGAVLQMCDFLLVCLFVAWTITTTPKPIFG